MADTPIPTEIKLHQKSRLMEVTFSDGQRFELSYEFLRGDASEPEPNLPPLAIEGPEETVFDYTEDACSPIDIPDAPARRNTSTPFSTSSSIGFGCTSVNTCTLSPTVLSGSRTRSARPAFTTPGSVTSTKLRGGAGRAHATKALRMKTGRDSFASTGPRR